MDIAFPQIKVSWASHLLVHGGIITIKIILTNLSFHHPDKLATLPMK